MPFGCEKVETVSIIAYPLDTLYHTEQRSFFEQYNNIEPKVANEYRVEKLLPSIPNRQRAS